MKNEASILAGTYEKPLTNDISEISKKAMMRIGVYSQKHIYNHRSVVEVELAGYQVIGGLLEAFVPALLETKKSHSSKKLLHLIPVQFYDPEKQLTPYQSAMAILDYISGMTDIYAVELYRRIKGISLPY